jgi:hypothetical protein
MVNKIVFSLAVTILVSTLLGLLFYSKFWIVFALGFILQFLFFYILNTVYENRLIEKAQKLKLEEFKEQTKHFVLVECPCNEKVKQDVEVRFDKDIIYKCNKCEKNIRAIPDVKTLLQTDPIYFNNDRTR